MSCWRCLSLSVGAGYSPVLPLNFVAAYCSSVVANGPSDILALVLFAILSWFDLFDIGSLSNYQFRFPVYWCDLGYL